MSVIHEMIYTFPHTLGNSRATQRRGSQLEMTVGLMIRPLNAHLAPLLVSPSRQLLTVQGLTQASPAGPPDS